MLMPHQHGSREVGGGSSGGVSIGKGAVISGCEDDHRYDRSDVGREGEHHQLAIGDHPDVTQLSRDTAAFEVWQWVWVREDLNLVFSCRSVGKAFGLSALSWRAFDNFLFVDGFAVVVVA